MEEESADILMVSTAGELPISADTEHLLLHAKASILIFRHPVSGSAAGSAAGSAGQLGRRLAPCGAPLPICSAASPRGLASVARQPHAGPRHVHARAGRRAAIIAVITIAMWCTPRAGAGTPAAVTTAAGGESGSKVHGTFRRRHGAQRHATHSNAHGHTRLWPGWQPFCTTPPAPFAREFILFEETATGLQRRASEGLVAQGLMVDGG